MPTKDKNPREIGKEKQFRYIYILEIDNLGLKSKFYGMKKILYVGQTNNLTTRIKQHISRKNSKFLANNFPNARRKLIYVETMLCNEWEAIQREKHIKFMDPYKKEELIRSYKNDLITYIPNKLINIRKIDKSGEIVLKL